MKRKRRDCPSPILDDSPKRTKVHAQRKFAQGSNVNSPVITPVKELERPERSKVDVIPEPVELLPIKRPNTEDFLTFLCFRGTPLLPPNLTFFNTASIVDTNGQVHEIKSESPKNGPIDTSAISNAAGPTDRPFIAFGVRKRADPVVISKQMDKKRRHALALQALRRKYQEQKMAKIRAVTISKLSEKVSHKTITVPKTEKPESISRKCVSKTKVIATKHIKVAPQTVKTTLRPKVKPKMCLRSFRGRFVQHELTYRNLNKKHSIQEKKLFKKVEKKKLAVKKNDQNRSVSDRKETENANRDTKSTDKLVRKTVSLKNKHEVSFRVTRSNKIPITAKSNLKQMKLRMVLSNTKTLIKNRVLRSHASRSLVPVKSRVTRNLLSKKKGAALLEKIPSKSNKQESNRSSEDIKKEIASVMEGKKKPVVILKKTITRSTEISNIPHVKTINLLKDVKKILEVTKSEIKNEVASPLAQKGKIIQNPVEKILKKTSRRELSVTKDEKESGEKKEDAVIKNDIKTKIISTKPQINKKSQGKEKICAVKKKVPLRKQSIEKSKSEVPKPEVNEVSESKSCESKCSQRPSRKTKEAAAIYMEILSHKLVNEGKTDDDTVSIDSFPELPNVKRTEQRENELKAKAVKCQTVTNSRLLDELPKLEKFEDKTTDFVLDGKIEIINDLLDSLPPVLVKVDDETNHKANFGIDKNNKPGDLEKELPQMSTVFDMTNDKKLTVKNSTLKNATTKKDNLVKNNFSKPTLYKKECIKSLDEELIKPPTLYKKEIGKFSKPVEKELSKILKDEFENVFIRIDSAPRFTKKVEPLSEELCGFVEYKPKSKTELETKEAKVKSDIRKGNPQNKTTKVVEKCELPKLSSKSDKDLKISAQDKVKTTTPQAVTITVPEVAQSKRKDRAKIISPCTSDSDEFLSKIVKMNDENKKEKIVKTNDDTKKEKFARTNDDTKKEKTKPNDEIKKENIVKINDEMKKEKIVKTTDETKKDKLKPNDETNELNKRRTRSSSVHRLVQSDDSDESFHADVKVPKKKQITRSKIPRTKSQSNNPKITSSDFESPENSDRSSISKVSNKSGKTSVKNKKFKKKRLEKRDHFSDSDEEPLSKLKNNIIEEKVSSVKEDILKPKEGLDSLKPKLLGKKKSKDTNSKIDDTVSTLDSKPKRECAKRPQNYLPMFSSSSDDEKFFLGFPPPDEPKTQSKSEEKCCLQSPDLTSKDVGRRFGKGKVNMSNEQIEKWLKDSVLAGSTTKKDEDFFEEIPTETNFDTSEPIDTQKLKDNLLTEAQVLSTKLETSEIKDVMIDLEKSSKSSVFSKFASDRKLIFRKEKKSNEPNANAFSPNNESSIYAFGEENEETISTPFRRPSRRPSSTATSKSEDEIPKLEEVCGQFRKPNNVKDKITKEDDSVGEEFHISDLKSVLSGQKLVSKSGKKIEERSTISSPKVPVGLLKNPLKRHESFEDIKYKIPSSPSASSSSSAKLYKRPNSNLKTKIRNVELIAPVKLTDFPCGGNAELVEAPTFYPTEKEFQDPIEYINKIGVKAQQFGICRIVPPSTFKPECKVTDDMRFTAYNQYVHKMLHRWGPNFKELMVIKKYLRTQNINLTQAPWIGGMEIDLPRLYQTVQSLGGLKEVIEKKKWCRVSEVMKIPKSAQDRVTKLDDIYCKYLLPYDTLSPGEREKLFDEIETVWAKRESKNLFGLDGQATTDHVESESESDNDIDECIVKGRNMALNAFYRIARNTMSMWFGNGDPSVDEIEQEFWKHVTLKQNHICVHSGSIDSGNWGYGFAVSKNSPFARHAWNLKVLTNNSGSVLRSLGPVMGVTVPTLHVGMVFSACCWYRDPHSLPWIEYLHTGGSKIWYGIPDSAGEIFRSALSKIAPNYCRNQTIWLPSDTVMIPPSLLIENGVSLCRTVQEPGQFIVVFPKAFTSSISTGYVVSESVFFAPPSWLKTAKIVFDELRSSSEPSMFSLDRLILSIINDTRSSIDVLKQIIPSVEEMCFKEKNNREKIKKLGVTEFEVLPPPEGPNVRKRKKRQGDDGDFECENCGMNLFISMIDSQDDGIFCLEHAVEQIEKNYILAKNCKILYTYSDEELGNLVNKIHGAIENKLQKKIPNKYSGMPTLLTK